LAGITMVFALCGDRTGRIWWPVSRFWAYGLVKSGGVTKIRTEGIKRIHDQSYGGVLMSNHASHLDPPMFIYLSKHYPLHFLVKHTLFYFPVFGQSLWAMGHIYVNRSKRADAFQSLDKAAASIAEGKRIYVFPEGTRTNDGSLGPFKKGGFHLAIKAKVPILPAGIAGTFEILPPGIRSKGMGPVAVVFGEPIPTNEYTLENKDELIQRVHSEIQHLKSRADEIRLEMLSEKDGGKNQFQ